VYKHKIKPKYVKCFLIFYTHSFLRQGQMIYWLTFALWQTCKIN